jgi:hypothetical protein
MSFKRLALAAVLTAGWCSDLAISAVRAEVAANAAQEALADARARGHVPAQARPDRLAVHFGTSPAARRE